MDQGLDSKRPRQSTASTWAPSTDSPSHYGSTIPVQHSLPAQYQRMLDWDMRHQPHLPQASRQAQHVGEIPHQAQPHPPTRDHQRLAGMSPVCPLHPAEFKREEPQRHQTFISHNEEKKSQTPMPKYHTALPGLLLKWAPIKGLVWGLLSRDDIDNCENLHICKEQGRSPLLAEHGDTDQPLDFTTAHVKILAESFNKNMMNMHPLLSSKDVDTLVTTFLGGQSSSPQSPVEAGMKTMQNALVLLILALGKVCQKDAIGISHGAGSQSPRQPLLTDQAQTSSSPSSQDYLLTPSNPSLGEDEIIPGLGYFAAAIEILEDQVGGNMLIHVYAHLLAGLYYGQLGRVMESWKHIHIASTSIQPLLDPVLGHLQTNGDKNEEHNDLVLAFWSCLQLESDILADLRLPHSGIFAYEQAVPWPNIKVTIESGFPQPVARCYFAQLFIRKHLNQIHEFLYNPDVPEPTAPEKRVSQISRQVNLLQEFNLSQVKLLQVLQEFNLLPQVNRLDEYLSGWDRGPQISNPNDELATDHLTACLLAEYWRAQAIIYRPLIEQIITANYPGGTKGSRPAYITEEVLDYAKKGVSALIKSTQAFHCLNRVIITNVWGTAHAQWGNLLILSAVYEDPVLKCEVDKDTLRELFRKTVEFFKVIAQPSSALHMDLETLEYVEEFLFPHKGPGANTSNVTSSYYAPFWEFL